MATAEGGPTERAQRTLASFAEGVAAMRRCHEGAGLRAHAYGLMCQLPAGAVELVATSTEGAGLAAAIAALRSERTTWRQVRLTIPQDWTDEVVFVVEPVEISPGLKRSLRRRLPRARFLRAVVDTAYTAPSEARTAARAAAAA